MLKNYVQIDPQLSL